MNIEYGYDKKVILIALGALCLVGCGVKIYTVEENKEDTPAEVVKEDDPKEETHTEEAKENEEDDNEYGLINGGTYTAK